MELDRSKFPLILLKGIERVLDAFSELEESHSEYVEEANPSHKASAAMMNSRFTPYFLAYKSVDKAYDFYFEVRGVRANSTSTIEYWVAFKPESNASTEETEVYGNLEQTRVRFTNWVSLLKEYASVRLSKKEKFLAESTQQFYQFFESADEDAATKPFDNDQQVYLYKLLDFARENIEQSEEVSQEEAATIVQEIKSLQEHIPALTKAVAVKKMSQIFAKVKALSMKLFMDTVDVAKKEAIKAALYGGLHQIEQGIHFLS